MPTDYPEAPLSPEEGEPISLLLLWAEAVADFVCLPPRLRARVLAYIAADIRRTLATMPDKEILFPWQIRQVNRAFGFEIIPVPPREWRVAPEGEGVRVIGE